MIDRDQVIADELAHTAQAARALHHREHDYTLCMSKPDDQGNVCLTSPDVTGLVLYGKPTDVLLDAPAAVSILDDLNGRRAPR